MNAPNAPRKRPANRPGSARRSGAGALVLGLLGWGAALSLVLAIILIAAVAFTTAALPSFQEMMKSPQGQSVVVRAADGSELVTLGPSYGRWTPYREIPEPMIAAIIAVEDKRFSWHPGVDPIGIARSAWVNWQAGAKVQGGSTITQQLARNIFLTRTQTYDRKIREIIHALAIERKFTKEQVLELYLNRVYFGGGAYGIDAASRKFFGHPATELDQAKSAIVAGLVQAPSRYSPTADPARARSRARIVLATMEANGTVTPAERQQLAGRIDDVRFVVDEDQGDVRFFTDWVLAQLDTLTDEAVQPLEVITTLDPAHQAAAEAAVKSQNSSGTQAAIVAMRPDGAVTAMVGGRDYASSNYNRATIAQRQPGSAWKLFPYLVALEEGMTPDDRVRDEPIRIGNYAPRNYNRSFMGDVTLRQAFAQSINTVAVQLGARHGFDQVAAMARRFGITTPISTQPAMALGASETTLLQMTSAYAAIAGGGVEARPFGIRSVSTASGTLLYNREASAPRVLVAPFVAAYVTDMMQAAVTSGTGRAARIGRPVAGKTGTTSSNKDGTFFGFTPDLVAGVWMGRDDARAVPALAGGQAPARIFASFMGPALANTPVTALSTDVAVPDFGLEPDAEVYGISPDDSASGEASFGPLPEEPAAPVPQSSPPLPEPMSQQWLEGIIADDGTRQRAPPEQ